jgi:tetratricopeptide (TPR) repeat protein
MRSAGGDPKSLGHRARSSPESEADGTELAAAIDEPPSPRELTARAQTCYLRGDFAAALDAYERAFIGLRSQPDERGALRVATWLAYLYAAVFGNFAACRGWLRRAQRLADT